MRRPGSTGTAFQAAPHSTFNWKIRRMSVKFDTFQLPASSYDAIRAVLASAGVADQQRNRLVAARHPSQSAAASAA
jgi:hypothetical protein